MNPNVVSVQPLDNFTLRIDFDNDEKRLFDTNPFLNKGIFQELKDQAYFKQVRVAFGAIEWPNQQDFSKDTLYLLSTPLPR